jgi:DNA-binding LytR/AlgR family response regulator
MKILICDSDLESIAKLAQIIRNKYNESDLHTDLLIEATHTPEEFLGALNTAELPFDIIFTDIAPGGEPGIPVALVAKNRFPQTQIIFFSANPKLAELIYVEMQPYAFINKPFNAEIVYHHIDTIAQKLSGEIKTLELFSNRQTYKIDLKRITYIESDRNKITVHLVRDSLTAISTLREIEKSLDENFIKCHKSFIVNLAYIIGVEKGDFLLATGERVPISRANLTKSKFDFMMYKGGVSNI